MSCLKKVRDDGIWMDDHFGKLAEYLQGCLDFCESKKDDSIRVTFGVLLESLDKEDNVLDKRESRTVFRVSRNYETDEVPVESFEEGSEAEVLAEKDAEDVSEDSDVE